MYEFQVEKMSCGGCANRVKKAVQSVDSAAQVDVDLNSKQVRIESSAAENALAAAIAEAGYPVRIGTAGTAEE